MLLHLKGRTCRYFIMHAHQCSSICHEEELIKALRAAKSADQHGHQVSRDIIYELLQRCIEKKDLVSCRYVRCLMVSNGFDFIAPLGDHLIRIFTVCGTLLDAKGVFLKISRPSIFTWNAVISAHVNLGESRSALVLFMKMQADRLEPDKVTFLHVLKACSNMQELGYGRYMHNQIIICGVVFDAAIGNTIIDMYAKCGSLQEAHMVFEKMPECDVISWGVMIAGYVTHDCCLLALELFGKMPKKASFYSELIVSCTLKACSSVKALGLGRLIHDKIEQVGIAGDAANASALVNMYSLFGLVQEAQKVFHQVKDKNVHMWGDMITGYIEHGSCDQAFQLFQNMQHEGFKPDKLSCLRILKACGSLAAMRQLRLLYDQTIRGGLDLDTMVGNTLVDVFAKCGSLEEARKVFSTVKNRDVVSWSVMISGYAQQGNGGHAIELFKKMQLEGYMPSKVSYLGALKACGSEKNLYQGRKIHDQIANTELMADVLIGSTLIDMYAKCGSLNEAREVFDCLPNRNVVVWGAMISGYAQHGLGAPALDLYKKMQREDITPDKVLFSSVLQGCASIGCLNSGRFLHDRIIRDGFESHLIVGNTLVDLYIKCGSVEEARTVFDGLPNRDVVTWGTMIAGYAHYNYGLPALELFESSQAKSSRRVKDLELNRVVLLGLLRACSTIRAAEQGQMIHNFILRGGLDKDLVVCNTLIDMYAKSGNLREARAVFEAMQCRDEVSWSALIAGYAWYGQWRQVRQCLKSMQQHGMKPDDVTFTNILTACSHGGLLEEGHWFFRCMREDHNLIPSIEHYSCLVDLLSRYGCLDEAEDLLRSIPILPDLIIWMSLLTSCKIYGNPDMGNHCFDHSLPMDPSDASGYMLMSSIYLDSNMRVDVQKMLELKRSLGAEKKRALAWIEIKGKIHEFLVGDECYPEADKIEPLSRQLSKALRLEFYVPNLDSVCKSTLEKDEGNRLNEDPNELAKSFKVLNASNISAFGSAQGYECPNSSKGHGYVETQDAMLSVYGA